MPTTRTATLLAATLLATGAGLLTGAGTAVAAPPAEPPVEQSALLGDIDLLNNLNVCPGVTAGLGLGNLLGVLGIGGADPVTNGGDVDCSIDDRDTEDRGDGRS